jgi:hypothetical protein
MGKESRNKPERYTLTKMQIGALGSVANALASIRKGRDDAQKHIDKMNIMEEMTLSDQAIIFEEIAEAHGLDKLEGKPLNVSKDLTTFTVGEKADGADEGQQEPESNTVTVQGGKQIIAATSILGPDGRKADGSDKAPNSGLDVIRAGQILAEASIGDIRAD